MQLKTIKRIVVELDLPLETKRKQTVIHNNVFIFETCVCEDFDEQADNPPSPEVKRILKGVES